MLRIDRGEFGLVAWHCFAVSFVAQKQHHLSGGAENLWYDKLACKTFGILFSSGMLCRILCSFLLSS
jgi:hypothetical protein